jgi:hypothetical protein
VLHSNEIAVLETKRAVKDAGLNEKMKRKRTRKRSQEGGCNREVIEMHYKAEIFSPISAIALRIKR